MRVKVDETLCTGHGRCYALAPDVFAPDDEGYNAARGQVVDVPDGGDEAARRAVESCPEGALSVID